MKLRYIFGALLLATSGLAHAADYPTRPVTIVVPFPPGGSTDNIARIIGAKLSTKFNQPFPIENKPGATGAIGAAQVKRAAADGYTLLVSSLSVFVVNPHLQKTLQYDPTKDFDLITVAVQAPNVLVAGPAAKGGDSVADLVKYMKKNPDQVTFATSGNGSSDHLTAELFWQETGTKGVNVPYKGGAPAQADLMGGQVAYSFQNLNAVIGHIRGGKMKALAVTSEKRSPLLPDVPTMEEAGVKNVVVNSWQAMAAPKGLPADVRNKLRDGVVEAMNDPTVKSNLLGVGFEIVGNTPEQFEKFQAEELARWKKVIESAGIQPS
ncbi:tripartite tricarboxylate transporter substrate binding protein [Candidimonas sp. SYP-B2681]|uniref:Bug family tripartite tricarboxylate transporter substrate binding protein n=1 Tax=Candidimonas sp. SYP-B2681 TaxID=2497686 RepID=UPI000F87B5BD|nr:tripartite tricarboxylate transporter substrate binding protein [Candidimonas sp. SYP-B2681]RTZ40005.1 tripartite tricarboxylate transporter substrate binding protein [Candidimonas sp. SYP-B2681]